MSMDFRHLKKEDRANAYMFQIAYILQDGRPRKMSLIYKRTTMGSGIRAFINESKQQKIIEEVPIQQYDNEKPYLQITQKGVDFVKEHIDKYYAKIYVEKRQYEPMIG
jgi:hypothetical protein